MRRFQCRQSFLQVPIHLQYFQQSSSGFITLVIMLLFLVAANPWTLRMSSRRFYPTLCRFVPAPKSAWPSQTLCSSVKCCLKDFTCSQRLTAQKPNSWFASGHRSKSIPSPESQTAFPMDVPGKLAFLLRFSCIYPLLSELCTHFSRLFLYWRKVNSVPKNSLPKESVKHAKTLD